MNLAHSLPVVSAAVALSLGASLLAGCGPSIDPAAKADIDRRVSTLKPFGQAWPAPNAYFPPDFAVGQWTQHKMVDDKGQPSFMTYKVVAQSGAAFWVEMANDTYYGKNITKILMSIGNRMDPGSVTIHGVKMRDKNGRVTEFDQNMVALMQSMWRGTISLLTMSWQGQPQEDAVVPAGMFSGCFKMRTDASWGPWSTASMSWSHAAVPLSGLVRSQGLDKPTTMELVGFGMTGAVSELP